ncbi:hypothetical protein [Mesorhizobium sp. B263B2A]|uniref:hypothetical protein n=1 Tax=Mesorhizobium sp. B263B2A TaxID=2876669 RepID=UPI001CD0E5B4|nr:hypothetical protein [Mesorhizobium sp. B263B2A]MCA0032757.1 hypothetical protein [Mesorhizobium sp. B263B2A]
MRIPSGKVDQSIDFVALDSTDRVTRKTGLSAFTVYRSRNGGTATVYTTPTVVELSAANMPGVYALLIDEDTTIASGSDNEEYCVHITCATMAPVTRTIELYRRDTTSGKTALIDSNGRVDVAAIAGTAQTARDIGASVIAASVTGLTASDVGAIKTKTDSLTFTVGGVVDSNVVDWKGATAPAMTGDAFARIGAPAGASVSADVAAVKVDTAAIKVQTDKVTFTVSNQVDVNVLDWKSATAPAMTGDAFARIGAAGAGLTALGDTRIAHLDADVSSRLAASGYTAPLDAAGVRSAVGLASANLDTQLDALPTNAELTTALAGADDATLAAIAALNNLSAAQVKTQADQALADASVTSVRMAHLDADVSSRSTYAGADTSGTTTLLSRLTNTRAGLLDNLDAAISTRLASGSYTAPDNAGIAAISAKTANLPSDPADQSLIIAATNTILSDTGSIKAKTDSLGFTVSGQVDANIKYVADDLITGNGIETTDEWRPA